MIIIIKKFLLNSTKDLNTIIITELYEHEEMNILQYNLKVFNINHKNLIQIGQTIISEYDFDFSNINVQYLENHNIICVATDYNDGDEAINNGYIRTYILNDGRWKKFCDDIEDQYEIDYNNLKIYSINDYLLLSNVYGIDNNLLYFFMYKSI